MIKFAIASTLSLKNKDNSTKKDRTGLSKAPLKSFLAKLSPTANKYGLTTSNTNPSPNSNKPITPRKPIFMPKR